MGPEPMIIIFFKSVRFAIMNPPYSKFYSKKCPVLKWKIPRQIPGVMEKESETETKSQN
jgi:hypothetical protein